MTSKRLQAIASYIPAQTCVADIGADHAYLLIYLAEQNRLRKGIAGELNPGPCQNAQDQVNRRGLAETIEVRLGNGLRVLQTGEAEVIVLAGMGGALISNILQDGHDRLAGVKRMILQPNQGGHRARSWLDENGWTLTHEEIIEESEILYEILVAEKGYNPNLYQDPVLSKTTLLEVGPLLWKEKHPLLLWKVKDEFERKQKVVKALNRARTEKAFRRKLELMDQLHDWERVMTCLLSEKN